MRNVLFLLIVLQLFSACKKEKKEASPIIGDRIKSETIVIQTGVSTTTRVTDYSYDNQGRVTQVQNRPAGSYQRYTYAANKVTEDYYDNNEIKISSVVYELNTRGLISRSVNDNGNIANFEFNNDGFLLRIQSTNGANSSVKEYYYKGANFLDSLHITYTGSSSSWQYTKYNQYIPGKKISIDIEAYGQSWWGKGYAAPYQRRTDVFSSSPTPQTVDYTYEFDTQNRVTKLISTSSDGVTVTTTYTYL